MAFLESNDLFAAATRNGWADDEAEPPQVTEMPEPLRWYLECQEYHCLLVAGGLLDQPAWFWQELQVAGRAYHEHQAFQAKLAELTGGNQ